MGAISDSGSSILDNDIIIDNKGKLDAELKPANPNKFLGLNLEKMVSNDSILQIPVKSKATAHGSS